MVCDAVEAPIALTAWEVPGQVGVPDLHRVFEATWTMVPHLVREAARVCAAAADDADGPALVEALTAPATTAAADPVLAAAFFNRAVAYLDRG